MAEAKIIILDIETAPKLAYIWRFFKENIGAKQVREHGHMMSFASKRLGQKEVTYYENRGDNEYELVSRMAAILDDCDIMIAHNAPFDAGTFALRCVVLGIKPPSPYKIIDTLREARKSFKIESYSLAYLSIILGCAPKEEHKEFPGFELWEQCLKGNPRAWKEMKKYNIQDVTTLEEVYLKMRPWIKGHPNVAIFGEPDHPVCPMCGGNHIQKRGTYKTNVYAYQRYQCQECSSWFRGRKNILDKNIRDNILMNL